MPEHERFRELSSLALVGELSGAEFEELKSHLRECVSCRMIHSEFSELAEYHLPLADRRPGRSNARAGEGVRARVLGSVVGEGLRISPEALRGSTGVGHRFSKRLEDLRWAILPRAAHLGISVGFLAVVAIAALAFRHNVSQKREIGQLRSELSQMRDSSEQAQVKLDEAGSTEFRAANRVEYLEQKLSDASARLTRLDSQHEQDLEKIHSLEVNLEQLGNENTAIAQRAHVSESELASLRGQLQQVREAAADREAQLGASEVEVAELSKQLKGQQAALDQEQQLLAAGRDIREVMGARNLHIIDVHDMDAHGESRPFGRIFLTEGKRLIFYAYDLDAIKAKSASFQAWGQAESRSASAVSLGILYMDDQSQSRWALKVEDPNVLNAINSIFVTVEPHGGTEKPTGKRLMYAYLRNPVNHP